MLRTFSVAIAAIVLSAPTVRTQQPDSGVVHVTIKESMDMLDGFRIQSAGKTAITNSSGRARLVLPLGPQSIKVVRLGYKSALINTVVVRDSVVSVVVVMSMSEAMDLEAVTVSATRTEKLAGETPIRVEVVDEMEVDENTLMSPSGIGMLLNETPGLNVQNTAPGLGTGSVRILGLPGQYTVMLADGLPLYGGSASALGPLDISPVDLQRVEIIKGAASALYGGQALGGVINLVAKPPTGKKEVLLNRRTLNVTDAATWLSQRFKSGVGVSLLASGTMQGLEDIDEDGWADQPRARRWNIRPRLNAVDSRGRSLFVTAGYGYDNRDGGTLDGERAPDGLRFHEGLASNRADIGAIGEIPLKNGKLASRVALSSNWRARESGPGPVEKDQTSTGFLEVTRSFVKDSAATVVGAALQGDVFENQLNDQFDHHWLTPALFVTDERPVGALTLSSSLRGDAHQRAGNQLTARVALLAKPVEGWSIRGSVGTGFAPPSATTEETEAVGLRSIRWTSRLKAEKSRAAMIDVNGQIASVELLITGYKSIIDKAIQLNEGGIVTLQNAQAATRIGGIETLAVWRFGAGKFIANYGYSRGTMPNAVNGVRETIPLIPRHRFGGDLMLEKPGVYRAGIEGTWYGSQSLDDNPYRTKSKSYTYVMAIVARQFGPFEAVANFENLLNVRQTDTDPLVRMTQTPAGRWTTDVWAPLEGFMANVAVRYRWGRATTIE